ncbi:hypothetical protein ABSL23_09735 [Halobacterium sp. NMX12-1]|uniref:PGF-CTERM sorting domain-containing protein n=1 Tax=Halobacterium sp. NMX12-1 TaxID=3166650 RepID=A0AAU8CB91_9EURY
MTTTTRFTALLVALAVVASATVGVAAAASDGSISADPAFPSGTSTHTVTATAGNDTAGSWNGFAVDYSNSGVDASNVSQDDVVTIGIDRGDDAAGDAVDVNVSDDLDSVSASNEGHLLTLGLGGSYDLDAGDEVVVVYEDAYHPMVQGSWETPLDVNPQSSGGETTATLTIESASTSDDTPTTEGDEQTSESTTDDATTDGTTAGTTDDGSTGGTSPGFGPAVAAVAIAGAALLASRD